MRDRYTTPVIVGIFVRLLIVMWIGGRFLFPDEQAYDAVGRLLASSWHHGLRVSPSAYYAAGTVTTGYFYYVAAIYYLFGPSLILVRLFNAVLSGFSAYFAGRLGEHFGVGKPAAWLVALYPTAVFWGAVGLKDGPLGTLFLASLMLSFLPVTLRRLVAQGWLLVAMLFTRLLVGVMALGVLAVALRRFAVRLGQGRVLAVLGTVTVAWLMFKVVVPAYQPTLTPSPGTTIVASENASLSNLSLRGIVRGILGPFPWSYGPGVSGVGEAQYPGQTILILLLPAALLGAWEAIRRGRLEAKALVVAIIGYVFVYQSIELFSEGFFRQRFDAELVLLILAAHAFQVRRADAVMFSSVWMCVVPWAALVQAGALPPVGASLLAAVIIGGWALEHRRSTRAI